MTTENEDAPENGRQEDGTVSAGKPKRVMSTVDFPYYDLDNIIGIAAAVHRHAGHQSCETADLAGWLGQTITSGTFRLRMSAARMFGIIKGDRGRVRLTEIGIKIVDPSTERQARADAFLSVPLYRAVYDRFRGKMLPSASGLESEMMSIGVVEPQKTRARQTFERAARQAGFFEHGNDRLIMPTTVAAAEPAPTDLQDNIAPEDERAGKVFVKDQRAASSTLHPLIEGLFATLPQPGAQWAIKDRAKWLQAAAFNFGLIYEGEGEVRVTAAVDESRGNG